jgi:uncharacterized protein
MLCRAMSSPEQLFTAIKAGDAEQVKSLLEKDPEAAESRDEKGVSSLLSALYSGKQEIAQLIREKRSGIDIFEAAALGDMRSLRQLLQQHPESAHTYSADGWTPLHLAAFFGQAEAVDELLAANADANARATNSTNNTPLHAAQVFVNVDVSRALLDHGADVNAKQEGGFTALQAAALHGCAPMVELLLERGADKSVRDDSGKSAADLAGEKGFVELARKLR